MEMDPWGGLFVFIPMQKLYFMVQYGFYNALMERTQFKIKFNMNLGYGL